MIETYFVPEKLIAQIVEHLQACHPEEACGLLAGKDQTFQVWIPIANVLRSTTRYRMDPEQQLQALLLFEQNGQDLLGIVHSHPNGLDSPSQTDLREAYYPEAVYFIFYRDGETWNYRAYRIQQDSYYPVAIQVIKSTLSGENIL
ncbi:MAG: M67 family metallopeptidase [Anaerolineales bacterium]|nr:M67 family metallopeptidase [Anaerolineales bacterium]MDW8448300.1 M67 family metallopeptidase [Anaerolineales bacterium]